MQTHRTRNLIIIVVLLAAVIYVLIPNTPPLDLFGVKRDLEPQLGLDLRGGLRVLLEVDLPETAQVSQQDINDARTILENRANALGVSEVVFETAGNRRLVGEFPGLKNTEEVIDVLKQTGQLSFVPSGSTQIPEGTVIKVDLTNPVPPAEANGTPVSPAVPASEDGKTPAVPATYRPLITGSSLDQVGVSVNQVGTPYVSFTLKTDAVKTFADYTRLHTGEFLSIVLDNKVIQSPVIKGVIDQGTGSIEGGFTNESANALAVQLRYGSLPVPFKIAQSQQVGATLGQDSINRSLIAGIIGLLIVILFMGIYYRLPGIIAALALLIYAATSLAIFFLIPVTLTLPGIAGFVLSIGVAVDANILIFSRLKEELRAGRGLVQAIDLAWGRAWPSIRDSNISTLITCLILYIFGSAFGASMVKGFALTLALGVFVSLFTAIFVTRTLLHLVLDNLKFTEHPKWFMAEVPAADSPDRPKIDIVKSRYLFFGLSLLIIIPGLLALLVWGLPLAIDFSGGSMLEVQFPGGAPQPAQMVQFYADNGYPGAVVQSAGADTLIVRSKEIDETVKTELVNKMNSQFNTTVTVNRFDTVGPSVSAEVGRSAALAVGAASLGILLYIWFAFRGVPNAYRFGIAAIVALLHDAAVVTGVMAILGHFLGWEVDSLFLTALLTVIGFSVHDTIVVFDRIRENAIVHRRLPFATIVNHSIVQTLDRSINTQLTVMLTLLALALFGGVTIREFVIVLLIGVLSGTYSSIFNAAQILVVWENREWRNWFRRSPAVEDAQKA